MTDAEILKFAREVLLPTGMINLVSVLISLVCSYVPGWREKWAAKDPQFKSIAMLIGITSISALVALVSFTGLIPIVPATLVGGITILVAWVSSLITNNTAYNYSPPVASVVVIKAQRNLLAQAKADIKDDKAIQKITDKAAKDEQIVRDKGQKDVGTN